MADTSTEPMATDAACGTCRKVAGSDVTLMACKSCKNVRYCSRGCQRADWKNHKKSCNFKPSTSRTQPPSSGTQSSSGNTQPGSSSGNGGFNINDFIRSMAGEGGAGQGTGALIRDKPEPEVFKLLIDSYRLRADDEATYRGDVDDDSLYGGGNPTIAFRRFLRKAERRGGVLPAWWTEQKREECIRTGDRRSGFTSLHSAAEKSDITEHYGNPMMPMQLRMLAEEIEGSNVMSF